MLLKCYCDTTEVDMPVGGMPPPSLRQLLFVLLLLSGVIGVPVGLIIWLAVKVMELVA